MFLYVYTQMRAKIASTLNTDRFERIHIHIMCVYLFLILFV